MSYTFEQVVEKVNSLHDKYKNYTDKIFLRSEIEAKHYGLKLYIRVVDLHPEPVDVANVTLRRSMPIRNSAVFTAPKFNLLFI